MANIKNKGLQSVYSEYSTGKNDLSLTIMEQARKYQQLQEIEKIKKQDQRIKKAFMIPTVIFSVVLIACIICLVPLMIGFFKFLAILL